MGKKLCAVLFVRSVVLSCLAPVRAQKDVKFDCGTITASGSGDTMLYNDLGHGSHFEFSSEWSGRKGLLSADKDHTNIVVSPMLASRNPLFYISEHPSEIKTETINAIEWTELRWPDGRRAYYSYHDGLAIEFLAMSFGKTMPPPDSVLASLNKLLLSLTFTRESSRLDRELRALRVGQTLGNLKIAHVVSATRGSTGMTGKIEFVGTFRLTGTVMLESTMLGGTSGYYFVVNDSSLPLISWSGCPLNKSDDPALPEISFINQAFAQRQFGINDYYEEPATVLVDRLSETFSTFGDGTALSARLLAVHNVVTPTLKIVVMADGRITIDGSPATIDSVRVSLKRLAEKKGVVLYYREGGEGKAKALPELTEIIQAVGENLLPIRPSTRPDFSDVIGPDGSLKKGQ